MHDNSGFPWLSASQLPDLLLFAPQCREDGAPADLPTYVRTPNGEVLTLPDGSQVPRLPSYRRWLWDGELCGSIGFRWQVGTSALPPHVLGHIVDGMVYKRDAAFFEFVGELELVRDLKLIHRLQLGLLAGWESIGSNVLIGIARPRGGGVRSISSEDERRGRQKQQD
jgi:hypothetical protein